MGLYLAPWTGKGTRHDPFTPVGSADQPGWTGVDLRRDCTRTDGLSLLYLPQPSRARRLVELGIDKCERVAVATRRHLNRLPGFSLSSGWLLGEAVGRLLMWPHKSLCPPLRPRRGLYEVWLNQEQFFLQPVLAGGSSATDAFTRANENPIAAPWTKTLAAGHNFQLLSNQLTGAGSASDSAYYYAGAATSDDQYCELQWVTLPTSSDAAMMVRTKALTTIDGFGYLYYTGGTRFFVKWVASVLSAISGSPNDTVVAGDYVRIEADGTTLRLYRDTFASPTTLIGSTTDSTSFTPGQPGLFQFEINGVWDNFRGGDLLDSAVAAMAPIAMQQQGGKMIGLRWV